MWELWWCIGWLAGAEIYTKCHATGGIRTYDTSICLAYDCTCWTMYSVFCCNTLRSMVFGFVRRKLVSSDWKLEKSYKCSYACYWRGIAEKAAILSHFVESLLIYNFYCMYWNIMCTSFPPNTARKTECALYSCKLNWHVKNIPVKDCKIV